MPRHSLTLPELGEMVEIPAGRFWMGAKAGDDRPRDERPRHEVVFHRPFEILRAPVTQRLYQWVTGRNPSWFQGPDRPVEQVSWAEALEFCNLLSQHVGLPEAYRDGELVVGSEGFRLPSEAEWEYAARGEEDSLYAGSNQIDEVGWYKGNSGGETHAVKERRANGYGLYDMSGNVGEWVGDWYHGSYKEAPSDGSAWNPGPGLVQLARQTGEQAHRVHRGGSWRREPFEALVTARAFLFADYRGYDIGFRLARSSSSGGVRGLASDIEGPSCGSR